MSGNFGDKISCGGFEFSGDLSEIFSDWQKFSVSGASVDFFEKFADGVRFIGFDSSLLTPPGPMLNATLALNLVSDLKTKIVMINHKFPAGLIPKVEGDFFYESCEIGGKFAIVFWAKNAGAKTALECDCKG